MAPPFRKDRANPSCKVLSQRILSSLRQGRIVIGVVLHENSNGVCKLMSMLQRKYPKPIDGTELTGLHRHFLVG